MKQVVTELMVMVLSSAHRNKIEGQSGLYSSYLPDIESASQIVTLQNWCIEKVLAIAGTIQNNRHHHISKVVFEAKAHIDANYSKDLALGDVSKMVAVSPQYFSKIFKEEIGLSFVEYIRDKRMDIAKEMIQEAGILLKKYVTGLAIMIQIILAVYSRKWWV